MHTGFLCGTHWVLLAFTQIIMEFKKREISTEAIYDELHRRSEQHSLISKLTRYQRRGYKRKNKLLIKIVLLGGRNRKRSFLQLVFDKSWQAVLAELHHESPCHWGRYTQRGRPATFLFFSQQT